MEKLKKALLAYNSNVCRLFGKVSMPARGLIRIIRQQPRVVTDAAIGLIALVLVVMVVAGCYPTTTPPAAQSPIAPTLPAGAQTGRRAPDFTLNSVDGNPTTFSNYRGKPVMLYFWTMTCSGCREKMIVIQEAWDKISPGTIGILCIHVQGRASLIQNYAAGARLTVPILLDPDGAVAERYGVTGIPTSFFLDGDGMVRLIDANFSTAEELIGIFQTMPGTIQNPGAPGPGSANR